MSVKSFCKSLSFYVMTRSWTKDTQKKKRQQKMHSKCIFIYYVHIYDIPISSLRYEYLVEARSEYNLILYSLSTELNSTYLLSLDLINRYATA